MMNGVMSAGEWCEPKVLCLTLLSKNARWDPSSYEPCGDGKVGITVFCPRAAFGSGRTYAVKRGVAGRGNVGSVEAVVIAAAAVTFFSCYAAQASALCVP